MRKTMTNAQTTTTVESSDIGTTPIVNKPQRLRRAFGSRPARNISNNPRWYYRPRSPKQVS